MDAGGLGLALVTMAASAGIQCYNILSEVHDCALGHDHLTWKLRTEKLRLERWIEDWGLNNVNKETELNFDEKVYRYCYMVETLARIVALLADVEGLRSKYGIRASKSGTIQKVRNGVPFWRIY